MISKNSKANKRNSDKLVLAVSIMIVASLGIVGWVKEHREKEMQKQEKARMELRSRQFAEYIIEGVEKQVGERLDRQTILRYIDQYKQNPQAYDQRIKDLMADSTRYADAIFRDAPVIHDYDKKAGKTLAFEEAMRMVEAEEALTTGPKVIDGNPVPGKKEVKGANPRRKLQVNRKQLRDTSQMLKEHRVARSMAK